MAATTTHTMNATFFSSHPTPRRMNSSSALSARSNANVRRMPFLHTNHSSVEDLSSQPDSDVEHGYQTDFTTPAQSETNGQEDMLPNAVEEFRDREYPQLKGKVYLDHGGTTLYAKSLIEEFSKDMIQNLYGNPHSASSPSLVAGHRVDAIRERTLRFFNANPDEFDLVFVANATAAIKMVIDCFKDYAQASNTPVWYGYHKDAHTSVVGVRESTKLHRCFTSDDEVDVWINSGGLGGPRARQLGLFAYPGQSNMTGRRLPLTWPGRIRKTFHKAPTYTLLDAAALASTAALDLSDPATAPDFVALSFYKIFGFPNIGALLVRKESAHVLQARRYFGGGTVDMIIAVNDTWHAKKDASLHDRLEDGTLPFHSIFALDHAMDVHERLYGPNPMKFISQHTAQLGKQLYDGLSGLRHKNGVSVCRIYKDDNAVYGDATLQGATVAFNVVQSDGSLVGYEDVESAADHRGIYVRSGSLCNPGGVATYLNWSPAEMKAAYAAGHRCSNPTQIVLGKPTGVVRVSLGAMSVASDIQTLLRFLEETYVDQTQQRSDERMSARVDFNASYLTPQSFTAIPTLTAQQSLPALNTAFHNSSPSRSTSTANTPDLASATTASTTDELPRYPPFIPADYAKLRKPWEGELRKQSAANLEARLREIDDADSISRNKPPSVKARRFGRSVVNLLRNKSHASDHSKPIVIPKPEPIERPQTSSQSLKSRRSVNRLNFQSNLDTFGLG